MPRYDEVSFNPPAPVALVTISAKNRVVSEVPLLIDTGADLTLLPRVAVERLGFDLSGQPESANQYELVGFDGHRSMTRAVDLDMIFLGRVFRGRYLIINAERGILGRDVLESVSILLDGPGRAWSEQIEP